MIRLTLFWTVCTFHRDDEERHHLLHTCGPGPVRRPPDGVEAGEGAGGDIRDVFQHFRQQAGPHRENHPVVFLPDGSKKGCIESGGMSAMGYLAFVVSGTLNEM